MNTFILGITMPLGGEILVSDLEYGAIVNICRLRAARDQMKLRIFHLPSDPEEMKHLTKEMLVDRILSEIKKDTRLILLSHAMTANGLTLPIEEIAKETSKRNILLAIDGAHIPGSQSLDFSKLNNVDFYGGNLHKWMMGPKGTGFGWMPERHRSRLKLIEGGWTSFETSPYFEKFGDGNIHSLHMLKSSSYNFAPFLALPSMINFWQEIGPEIIFKRLIELQTYAEKKMSEVTGWRLCSPSNAQLRGPLSTFELPDHLEKMGRGFMEILLQNHKIQIVNNFFHNRWHLRLSPHIYNDETEIEHTVNILAQYIKI
jgi:isopenicillin-N epimerase